MVLTSNSLRHSNPLNKASHHECEKINLLVYCLRKRVKYLLTLQTKRKRVFTKERIHSRFSNNKLTIVFCDNYPCEFTLKIFIEYIKYITQHKRTSF